MAAPQIFLTYSPQPDFPTFDEIMAAWTKLGMAYELEEPTKPVDPERTILLSMRFLSQEASLIPMLKSWLTSMGDLVNIDRLNSLMNSLNWISGHDKIEERFLGGLALHTMKFHKSWQKIVETCKKDLVGLSKNINLVEKDNFQANAYGTDPDFAEFSLTLANGSKKFAKSDGSYSHKIRTREMILLKNPWLRLRLILPFWRADLLFGELKSKAANARQLSLLVGCAYRTAYQWCRDSDEANASEIFSGFIR